MIFFWKESKDGKSDTNIDELQAVIMNYQKKAREMTDQITDLESKLSIMEETSEEKQAEKSRYKPLARKEGHQVIK